jgi:hypothetical protein
MGESKNNLWCVCICMCVCVVCGSISLDLGCDSLLSFFGECEVDNELDSLSAFDVCSEAAYFVDDDEL